MSPGVRCSDDVCVPDDRSEVRELLANIKRDHATLVALLDRVSDEWVCEDLVYRFWHQSWKVFFIQDETLNMVNALRSVAPKGCSLNPWFERIIEAGTGVVVEREHNQRWLEVARPMLEAFWHARFMVGMATRYGQELEEPPTLLPSGWAALLYLYGLR